MRISGDNSQAHAVALPKGRLDAALSASRGCPAVMPDTSTTKRSSPRLPTTTLRRRARALPGENLRDETLLVMADGTGPEVEGTIVRRLSTLGFRPKIAVQHFGRDNLLNMVDKGYGLTFAANSILGAAYPRVRFVPIEPAEIVSWSVVCPNNNANPALKRLLELSVAAASSTLPIVA
jgi:DNA-binding transcriptional LysR family regulator